MDDPSHTTPDTGQNPINVKNAPDGAEPAETPSVVPDADVDKLNASAEAETAAPATDDQLEPPPIAAPPAEQGRAPVAAATIVAISTAVIVALSLWYLRQPQPLLVQGEADATRIDIAARVDGRIGQRPVSRGDNVKAGQLLVSIDNPELRMKLNEAEAARLVAVADLTRVGVGARHGEYLLRAFLPWPQYGRLTWEVVKKEIDGGYLAIPDDRKIGSGVGWRPARGA